MPPHATDRSPWRGNCNGFFFDVHPPGPVDLADASCRCARGRTVARECHQGTLVTHGRVVQRDLRGDPSKGNEGLYSDATGRELLRRCTTVSLF